MSSTTPSPGHAGDPYRWVSTDTGRRDRKRHLRDCTHFYDDLPPRLAEPDEMGLPVCQSCGGTDVRAQERKPAVCQTCGLVLPATGRCDTCD